MDLKKTIEPEREAMYYGLASASKHLLKKHPVELSEQSYDKNYNNIRMDMLRRVQGIHAPLRLMMERKLTADVGRLPFLKSSNLMREVLEGKQDYLDFSDGFKDPMVTEIAPQPHLLMEKRLGML